MASRPLLRAQGITFSYDGHTPVLANRSFECEAGKLTAITGPSGCGKSTLMYILAGLLQPAAGEVFIGDQNLYALDDVERSNVRAERFGFVFQDFALDNRRSLLDNVLEPSLYARADRHQIAQRARHLLEELGVGERPEATPLQLSGGQAQRVALARAMLLEPEIIFADEPTGNLDGAASQGIIDLLRQRASAGAGVIIVTHDDRVRHQCDEVIDLAE